MHFVHEKEHFVPQTHIFSLVCTIIWIERLDCSIIMVRGMKALKRGEMVKRGEWIKRVERLKAVKRLKEAKGLKRMESEKG